MDTNQKVKDSVKEFTVPTLTHCVHECIGELLQNCSGISYLKESQSCSISNRTELTPSLSSVETYLSTKNINSEYIK